MREPVVPGHLAKRFQRLLLGAAAMAVLVPGAWAQQIVSTPPAAAQTAAQIQAYWTAERMQNAIPIPMPQATAAGTVMQSKRAGIPADAYPMIMPGWEPRSGQPQPTADSMQVFRPGTAEYNRIMSGQPMVFGSPPANPVDFANYGKFQRWTWFGKYVVYPLSTIGKMFFSQNGGNFVCSGTVWDRNTFLTAGHCVSDGTNTFSTNILFCPSFNSGGINPSRGCWAGIFITTTTDWHTASDFDRDYACVVTSPTGTLINNSIGNITGWAGWAVNFASDQAVFSTGYPAAPPFNGSDIIFTSANEWYTVNLDPSDAAVSKYIGNDMTGGSSGGSWWLNIAHRTAETADVDGSNVTDPGQNVATPFLNGLNSHKRCRVNCSSPPTAAAGIFWDEMGGPQFTSSGADNRDILDVRNVCLANGGD